MEWHCIQVYSCGIMLHCSMCLLENWTQVVLQSKMANKFTHSCDWHMYCWVYLTIKIKRSFKMSLTVLKKLNAYCLHYVLVKLTMFEKYSIVNLNKNLCCLLVLAGARPPSLLQRNKQGYTYAHSFINFRFSSRFRTEMSLFQFYFWYKWVWWYGHGV